MAVGEVGFIGHMLDLHQLFAVAYHHVAVEHQGDVADVEIGS